MKLYSFRGFADAAFLLVALSLAVASFLLVVSTLLDHLRNYKYPALQVRSGLLHEDEFARNMCSLASRCTLTAENAALSPAS